MNTQSRLWPWCLALLLVPGVLYAASLFEAIEQGDEPAVVRLLEKDPAGAGALENNLRSPLQAAIESQHLEIARLLVMQSPCVYVDRTLDARTEQGRYWLKQGRLQELQKLFATWNQEYPNNERILFGYGMVCHSVGAYPEAEQAMQEVLALNPGNHRARVEHARLLVARGHPEEARAGLNKVLAQPLAPTDRAIIEYCLQQIDRDQRTFFVWGRADAGALYDDNINIGPRSDIIEVYPIKTGGQDITRLYVPEESQPQEAFGGYGSLTLAAAKYFSKTASLWGEGFVYQNWLDGKNDYQTMIMQGSFGPRFINNQAALLLPAIASYIRYGDSQLLSIYGAQPLYLRLFGRRGQVQSTTRLTAQYRDYATLDGRDGVFLGLDQKARYISALGHSFGVQASVLGESTDASEYSHLDAMLQVEGRYQLPWRIACYGRAGHTWAAYEERETLAPEKRSDRRWETLLGLTKQFATHWAVDVNWMYINSVSSFDLYEYRKNVATLSTTYYFW